MKVMPRDQKKRKESSDSNLSDSENSADEKKPPAKKQKTAASKSRSANEEPQWQLTADKIIKIREFKGKLYIDIRQYYKGPDGDLLPTKKGISLTAENYQKFKKLIDYQLNEYMDLFNQEISRGLSKDTADEATVKSIVTHVNKKPSGKEEGQFLGLDFSGPTIKVMLVKLFNRECNITRKFYDIPPRRMSGKSEKLFDFVAKCLVDFLKELKPKLKMNRIPLGVTFGFPILQTSLQDCKLLRWSKGFSCDDLINKNVFVVLQNSLRKYPELKKIFVIGILNDAVSAVLACAWQDPTCTAGAAIGPGLSCCYVEKVYRVTKYEAETYGVRDIYINLESAQLGEDGCLDKFRSKFDFDLDQKSNNPGKIINEKLISSVYFGELVRLILLDCVAQNLIFIGEFPDSLLNKNSIKLEHLKRIESDPELEHEQCRQVLQELGFENPTDEDCFQVQFIARVVSRRSANLAAAQLATLLNRVNSDSITVSLNGDLIKDYPKYEFYLVKKLGQLKNKRCEVAEAEESSLGAAIMAAVFGEEVMDRDEKFRRLPGFPMDKCHFRKVGKCLNPDCQPKHPCDKSAVNPCMRPMETRSQDIGLECKEKDGKGCCKGYDKM